MTPGTLRFYESKGVLLPALRQENGYRLYSDEQLKDAYLISSLRHAGIGLEEIRAFLSKASLAEREQHLNQWRQEVASRLLSLQVAQSYLSGISADRHDIHLIHWDEPVRLLWFSETVPGGPAPFAAAIRERRRHLQRLGIRIGIGSFVRVTAPGSPAVTGQIGFAVEASQWRKLHQLPPGAWEETLPPSLFAAVECAFDDTYTRFRINRFFRDFRLEAAGKPMERHISGQEDSYQLMIPVRHRKAGP